MDISHAVMNPVFTNFDRATARCRERLRPLIILRRNRGCRDAANFRQWTSG
jgi:hypothetical protein